MSVSNLHYGVLQVSGADGLYAVGDIASRATKTSGEPIPESVLPVVGITV